MTTLNYISLCVGDYPSRMKDFGELPVSVYFEGVFELVIEKAEKAHFNMVNVAYSLNFLDKIKKPNISKEVKVCSNPNLNDVVCAILNENQVLGIVSSLGIQKTYDPSQKVQEF